MGCYQAKGVGVATQNSLIDRGIFDSPVGTGDFSVSVQTVDCVAVVAEAAEARGGDETFAIRLPVRSDP